MRRAITGAALLTVCGLVACNKQPTSLRVGGIALGSGQTSSRNPPIPCGKLATLALPNTTIVLAESVAAGAFVPSSGARTLPSPPSAPLMSYAGLPAFCRVVATVRPVPDSEIKLEVWMPAQKWNGKFVGTGNAGASGFIIYPYLAEPLARGYAVGNTDTGHDGGLGDWSFAVGHPGKLIDFGYRAVHEMTVNAKAIIAAHYGTPADRSYWTGCSAGGWQGLVEAHRFPADYDGIVAGAPGNDTVLQQALSVLVEQATTDPAGALTRETLATVNDAAIAACDAADGVRDGVVTNPRTCKFDPAVVQCTASVRFDCLTSHQVEWVKRIYRGLVNPRTGEHLYPGPEPTSESDWIPPAWVLSSGIRSIGPGYFRHVVFSDASWSIQSLDVDADIDRARKQDGGVLVMTDPDLSAFGERGGKLLLWHGWSDGAIPPQNTINYYNSVVARMGAATVKDDVRLFMVPGAHHCGGGVDYLSVMEQWVEGGKPPERIIARRPLEGGVMRTRPLCPYPQIPTYSGKGNTDDAANFECVAPSRVGRRGNSPVRLP